MTRTLAITQRELRERSMLFLTAAIVAVIPFVAMVMPGMRRFGSQVVLVTAAGGLSFAFTLGVALTLGVSMVGRELSDHRLSFYFSKPVTAAGIWFGKLTAAVITVVVCFTLIYAPAVIVGANEWRATWGFDRLLTAELVIALALIVLLMAHAAGTMIRSRTPLILLDLCLLGATAGAGWLIARPLLGGWAELVLKTMLIVFTIGATAALVFAGWRQLANGRTDIRGNHRALSASLWISIGAMLVVAAAYVGWVVSVTPFDLQKVTKRASSGDWVLVSGTSKGRGDYLAAFLLNTHSKEWIRAIAANDFTHAGNGVLGLTRGTRSEPSELIVQHLDGDHRRVETGLLFNQWPGVVASDDLTRLALASPQTLSVYDIDKSALLASVRLPESSRGLANMWFLSRDLVRVYLTNSDPRGSGTVSVDVFEFDVAHRRLQQTGSLRTIGIYLFPHLTPDGSTLLISSAVGTTFFVADPRTGAPRVSIPAEIRRFGPRIISDGRFATVSDGRLQVFMPDGSLERNISLPREPSRIIDELPGNHLLLATWEPSAQSRWTMLSTIDLTRGVIERSERDYSLSPQIFWTDPRMPTPRAERTIVDEQGRLWRWNTLTGEKLKLIGG